MNDRDRASAAHLRAELAGRVDPTTVRAALLDVAAADRDAWVDLVLALGELPDDGPALPRGGTPYLPCSVDALLRIIALAPVTAADVFVDLGAGAGRAGALVHLLTGAEVIGVEIQPHLAAAARALATRVAPTRITSLEGDAPDRVHDVNSGSVFFLYCPFGGARLERVLDGLETIARARTIRLCCVDLPLPQRNWLRLETESAGDVRIYRGAP